MKGTRYYIHLVGPALSSLTLLLVVQRNCAGCCVDEVKWRRASIHRAVLPDPPIDGGKPWTNNPGHGHRFDGGSNPRREYHCEKYCGWAAASGRYRRSGQIRSAVAAARYLHPNCGAIRI